MFVSFNTACAKCLNSLVLCLKTKVGWFGSTTTLDILYARNISRPGTFISIKQSDKNIKTKEVYSNYESKYYLVLS